MPRRKSAAYMSAGEQIAGTVLFVIYLLVLPFVTTPLFRLIGGLLGVTISTGLQNILYYYILFAATLIIFHGFLGRTSRNFADNLGGACKFMAIGLVALYMVQEVAEARENGRALQVLFPVGAVLWTFLFQTQLGILVVLAMTAMYFLRERPLWRDILVAVLGLATIPASLSVLLIHFHRPEPSMFPKWIYYAAYPIQLLVIGLIGYFLL